MSSQHSRESPLSEEHAALGAGPSRIAGPGEFLTALLAAQCRTAPAESAAALHLMPGAATEIAALWPTLASGEPLPDWLTTASHAAEEALKTGATAVASLPDAPARADGLRSWIIATPRKRGPSGADSAAAYLVLAADRAELTPIIARLDLTAGLLTAYELELTLRRREGALRALRVPLEVVAALNEHETLGPTAMRVCNEIAARWRCERVSLGFVRSGVARLAAMSHVEHIDRRTRIVQDIEAAMEEAIDQDVEVILPDAPESMTVSRCAQDLSSRHGPTAVCAAPIRRAGAPLGAIVAERPISDPFTQSEIDALRLTCDLVSARLLDLNEHGRWLGVRLARDARLALAALVGPRYTWAKVGAILGFWLVVFLTFAKGVDWIEAPFTLEAIERRIVSAPYEAIVASSEVQVGDEVIGGQTVLATLETSERRLALAAAIAERTEHATRAAAARSEGKTAESRIAQAEADRVQARIDLLESQLAQARIIAPISGALVAGELRRAVGAPVRTGEALFEIAPIGSLRASIRAPEGRAADLAVGQRGVLAVASRPGERGVFHVEHIDPMAEARDGRSAFTVRAAIESPQPWMRPGMTGVAKIDSGRRRLVSIWTRPVVDWLRLRFWL